MIATRHVQYNSHVGIYQSCLINQSGCCCCCCCGCVFVSLKVKRNKIKNSNDRQGIATDKASVCRCSLPVWMKNVNENSVFKAVKGRTLFGRKTKSMLNRGHEDTDSEKKRTLSTFRIEDYSMCSDIDLSPLNYIDSPSWIESNRIE